MLNKKYFFIGIGGIGMSSIAQFLHDKGNIVFGYDQSNNRSIEILLKKGIAITNKLNLEEIPEDIMGEDLEIIYTPAIKKDNIFLNYFISNGKNKIYKRSEILGEISQTSKCIAVAGTHGKTTTTAIISDLFYSYGLKFKAFVGGIMKRHNSNYLFTGDDYVIVEADEYDRSFLNLSPDYAVITSLDSDHLDIYGDFESLSKSFKLFSKSVKNSLVVEKDINIKGDFTFSIKNDADYKASSIIIKNDGIIFDFKTPDNFFTKIYVNIIGLHNLKNVLSALSIIDQIKEIEISELLPFLSDLNGIERRMDIYKIDDKIIIAVYENSNKNYLFDINERLNIINKALFKDLKMKTSKIKVIPFNSLTTDLCKKMNSKIILRGLRAVSDFEYEFQLAGMNRKLNNKIETVFLMSDVENQIISSRFVKEIVKLNGNIKKFTTKSTIKSLKEKYE